MQHYLRPLVAPTSVALVGASERPGSLGRITYENLLAGGFTGKLYAVNPNHRMLFGNPVYATLADIKEPVELAVIATPSLAVPRVIAQGAAVRLKAAVIMSSPPMDDPRLARRWTREVLAAARKNGVRIVGATALGVIRTDIGLDATYCAPVAVAGRLAIIAQSGAVATALLDFAARLGMGFSTVISLGSAIDVDMGELLDCMLVDPLTDGILLYVEEVHDARRFISALRAAARTKPVVVLKAGKSIEPRRELDADAVFSAALRRAGTVRVHTYSQLFAAARILSGGHLPQGDRLAIVSNGRGPALLAADSAADRGVALAQLSPETVAALDGVLPSGTCRVNPVDVRGDASPERFAAAISATLGDPKVDAVLVLHVPRPSTGATDVARAVADVARSARKPVLAAWLGTISRTEVHAALDAGGVADFYTPENAVDAFAFVAAYRRNQALLLETPPSAPEPEVPDLIVAERLRNLLATHDRTQLTLAEALTLLAAFGIGKGRFERSETLAEAQKSARKLHFPVRIVADAYDATCAVSPVRTSAGLTAAWGKLHDAAQKEMPSGWTGGVVLVHDSRHPVSTLIIGVAYDPTFGPVITAHSAGLPRDSHAPPMMLPPLNERLALDLIAALGEHGLPDTASASPTIRGSLARILTQVSTLTCELPWIRDLRLAVVVDERGVEVRSATIRADPARTLERGYQHMAIHPYPTELIADMHLRDGTPMLVRPIRPEDADLEREFVHGLSEETRYMRFFYRMNDLTPGMLARFTQVDYDRELALVAVARDQGADRVRFVGVARYSANPDNASAEFAVVVDDAWQRRGVARVLMERLMAVAQRNGYQRLEGAVLRANRTMLAFVTSLGFTVAPDPDDPEQVHIEKTL